ncbi:hypothetical protein [Umezawaea tangerina]|uniref:Lipoprotein n=1 Tax=Umezawaea tangerina TaxID=84725 RepID=A0A2T0SPF7_9PSEU|nr:hypothetical protein [Umezawaea tangerina]PRY35299.1 hypothetical protein CLV43_114217 [Umezawaea tangerina]
MKVRHLAAALLVALVACTACEDEVPSDTETVPGAAPAPSAAVINPVARTHATTEDTHLSATTTAAAEQSTLAQQQAAGLRALADMIEANPDLADLACYLRSADVFYAWSKDDVAKIVRAGLAHGFGIAKNHFGATLKVTLEYGPLNFTILGDREAVCEKVVTTETVTRTVPDPAVLATVPLVEVTETVENVEWVCKPLLAGTAETTA